ncbi:unnamed protein product [Meloidogyne enterolobii]|uniref:Uncharacterized protein n=2 Tax=Meloidogyne enterolobii TaxID=390850 RepID=A0ACB0XSS7_MELEN
MCAYLGTTDLTFGLFYLSIIYRRIVLYLMLFWEELEQYQNRVLFNKLLELLNLLMASRLWLWILCSMDDI